MTSGDASLLPTAFVRTSFQGCFSASSGATMPPASAMLSHVWSLVICRIAPWRIKYARLSPSQARVSFAPRAIAATTVLPMPE